MKLNVVTTRRLLAAFSLALFVSINASAQGNEEKWVELNKEMESYAQKEQYDRAVEAATSALLFAERNFGHNHDTAGRSHSSLGLFYEKKREYQKAEQHYRRSLEIYESNRGQNDLAVATILSHLGELSSTLAKHEEAESYYARSIKIRANLIESQPEVIQDTDDFIKRFLLEISSVGFLLQKQDKHVQAKEAYVFSQQIIAQLPNPDHWNMYLASSLTSQASNSYESGDYAEAEELFKRAIALFKNEKNTSEDVVEAIKSSHSLALDGLARLYQLQGKYEESIDHYMRCIELNEGISNKRFLASSLSGLGRLYIDQRQFAEAEPFLQRALLIMENTLGEDDPGVANTLRILALSYNEQKMYAEAEVLYRRALRIRNQSLVGNIPMSLRVSLNLARLVASTDGMKRQKNISSRHWPLPRLIILQMT